MSLQRARHGLDLACGALAALALFAIMALTLADVTGRKLAAASLPGSLELTELLMVAVIFAALPLVSAHRGHVVFDSLDALLPRRLRRAQQVSVELLSAALVAGLAWLMGQKGAQMQEAGDVTAQLHIAQGPFVYAMGALLGLTALVHLLLAFEPAPDAPHRGPGEEPH